MLKVECAMLILLTTASVDGHFTDVSRLLSQAMFNKKLNLLNNKSYFHTQKYNMFVHLCYLQHTESHKLDTKVSVGTLVHLYLYVTK